MSDYRDYGPFYGAMRTSVPYGDLDGDSEAFLQSSWCANQSEGEAGWIEGNVGTYELDCSSGSTAKEGGEDA